jgi:flagellar assembly protein FliH
MVKFMFEDAFDGDTPSPKAVRFTQEDLDVVREQALAQGIEQGVRQTLAQLEGDIAVALEKIAADAGTLIRERAAVTNTLRAQAVTLAHALATRLAGRLMEDHPLAEIEALVTECLGEHYSEPRLVIRTSEALLEPLRERIDALAAEQGFPGHIVLLADPALAGSDCRIEWPDGGVERNRQALLHEVDSAIERYLAQINDPANTTHPTDPTEITG